uniref:Uncharacterized protein n=1 Tax=Moniliophthora roreri TaxID=221103 RepID=A0A0W0G213_MONRR
MLKQIINALVPLVILALSLAQLFILISLNAGYRFSITLLQTPIELLVGLLLLLITLACTAILRPSPMLAILTFDFQLVYYSQQMNASNYFLHANLGQTATSFHVSLLAGAYWLRPVLPLRSSLQWFHIIHHRNNLLFLKEFVGVLKRYLEDLLDPLHRLCGRTVEFFYET